jgi:membrane protease subunit (stomatin/prohibitin family)
MAIVQVVKYNGNPQVFAWKYPSEELGTWTQLIVNEAQEALLFKGGQALDLFLPGRHTLETANIPLLNNIINLPFGGRSPFAAEVWYVNKVHSLDIKWGTPTPIQLQDPKYKVFLPVRSFGQFGIQIGDSRKFLTKLVGTLSLFDKANLLNYFRGLYLTKVKDSISSYLIKKGISVLEINAYLDELSDYLKERMIPTLDEYGIKLVNFFINDISVPEEDPAVKKLKDALAKRAEMDIVGYSYVQERSFDTLEGAATNPGGGQSGLMGAGIGLGMGVGIGGAFGSQVGGIAQNIYTKELKMCPKCKSEMETDKRFCSNCGFDTSSSENEQKAADNKTACSKCGAAFSKKSKFCPECGNPYTPCPFCGADMGEGTKKCQVCGKDIPHKCPKCGVLIKEKAKFCPECGQSLLKTCSSCGAEIEGSPRFCPECGNKLEKE